MLKYQHKLKLLVSLLVMKNPLMVFVNLPGILMHSCTASVPVFADSMLKFGVS